MARFGAAVAEITAAPAPDPRAVIARQKGLKSAGMRARIGVLGVAIATSRRYSIAQPRRSPGSSSSSARPASTVLPTRSSGNPKTGIYISAASNGGTARQSPVLTYVNSGQGGGYHAAKKVTGGFLSSALRRRGRSERHERPDAIADDLESGEHRHGRNAPATPRIRYQNTSRRSPAPLRMASGQQHRRNPRPQ